MYCHSSLLFKRSYVRRIRARRTRARVMAVVNCHAEWISLRSYARDDDLFKTQNSLNKRLVAFVS